MIRAFIALELKNQETIEKIQSYGKRLKNTQLNLKLVEPQNLHMTVKFLGNIKESTAPIIYKILKEEINEKLFQSNTYQFELIGTGQFRKYSVLWIKLKGDIQFLQNIKDRVETLLYNNLNIEKDKRAQFKPHLTIGRLKSNKINYRSFKSLKKLINDNKNLVFGSFRINEIKFKQSVLTPNGPIYSDLVY